jgi:hypothetical protein
MGGDRAQAPEALGTTHTEGKLALRAALIHRG